MEFESLQGKLKRLALLVLAGVNERLVATNLVTKGQRIDSNFAEINQDVYFEIEPSYPAVDFKKGGTVNHIDIVPKGVSLNLDSVARVPLRINLLDKINFDKGMEDKHVIAAQKGIFRLIETNVIKALRQTGQYHSIPSTPTYADLANFTQKGITKKWNDRQILLDPYTTGRYLGLSEISNVSARGRNISIEDGDIGQILGVPFFQSNVARTKETPADTELSVNNAAGYAKGATSIVFDNGVSADIQAGDMIKFANHDTYYTVAGVTFSTAGEAGTITIVDGLTAAIVNDEAITVKRPNDSFMSDKACVLLGNAPLRPYASGKVLEQAVTTSQGSLRVVLDQNVSSMDEYLYIEYLYGIKQIDPSKQIRFVDLT